MINKICFFVITTIFLSISIQAQTLAGNWKLSTIIVESDMVYTISEPITLNFDGNGNISGNGGCNDFQGKYSFKQPKKPFKKPKKIRFSEISTTEKDCQLVSDTEKAFIKSLKNAAKIVFEKGKLVIKNKPSYGGGMLIQDTLTFVKVEETE